MKRSGPIPWTWAFAAQAHASCYYPDGSLASNTVPCVEITAHSACCSQGYVCLSNGICQATGPERLKPGAIEFVRGTCTDMSWKSSSCPLFCNDPRVDESGTGEGLSKCVARREDSYHCVGSGNDHRHCDSAENLVYFPENEGKPSPTTSADATSVMALPSTPSGLSTTSTVSSSFPPPSPSSISSSPAPLIPASTLHIIRTYVVSPPATTPAAINATQPTVESAATPGAIIGGSVAGSAVGMSLLVYVLWYLVRRRNQRLADARGWNHGHGEVHEVPA